MNFLSYCPSRGVPMVHPHRQNSMAAKKKPQKTTVFNGCDYTILIKITMIRVLP